MSATAGQTDRQTDKSNAYSLIHYGWGVIIIIPILWSTANSDHIQCTKYRQGHASMYVWLPGLSRGVEYGRKNPKLSSAISVWALSLRRQ